MFLPIALLLIPNALAVPMDDDVLRIMTKWSTFLRALESPVNEASAPKAIVEEKVSLGGKKKVILQLATVVTEQKLVWKLEKAEPSWLQVKPVTAGADKGSTPPKVGVGSGTFEIEAKPEAKGTGTATFVLRFSKPYKNKNGQEFKEVRYRLTATID